MVCFHFVRIAEINQVYNATCRTISLQRRITMRITDIKIRKVFDDESPLKAVVSVTFDDLLALHDVKVIYAKEKYFIVMPSKKNPDGTYRDIAHPIKPEFREELNDAVLEAYFEELKNLEAVPAEN